MGLLLFYPTPVFEKEEAMPEDFNKRLEKWIIDYSESNEESKNWSKKFYGAGFTSYGSDQKLHEKEEIFRTIEAGINRYSRLTIPPRIWFGFKGLGKPESIIINLANIQHDPKEVLRCEKNRIKFNW